jgi:hypothetical protein
MIVSPAFEDTGGREDVSPLEAEPLSAGFSSHMICTHVSGKMVSEKDHPMRVYKFLNKSFAMQALGKRRLKIARLAEMNDPIEMLPFDLSSRNQRLVVLMTLERLNGTAGVLCFSNS